MKQCCLSQYSRNLTKKRKTGCICTTHTERGPYEGLQNLWFRPRTDRARALPHRNDRDLRHGDFDHAHDQVQTGNSSRGVDLATARRYWLVLDKLHVDFCALPIYVDSTTSARETSTPSTRDTSRYNRASPDRHCVARVSISDYGARSHPRQNHRKKRKQITPDQSISSRGGRTPWMDDSDRPEYTRTSSPDDRGSNPSNLDVCKLRALSRLTSFYQKTARKRYCEVFRYNPPNPRFRSNSCPPVWWTLGDPLQIA